MNDPTVVVAAVVTMDDDPDGLRRSKRGPPSLGNNDQRGFDDILKSIQWDGTEETKPYPVYGIEVHGVRDVTLSVHLSFFGDKLYDSEFAALARALVNSTRVDALYLFGLRNMNDRSLGAIMTALVENEDEASRRGGHSAIEHLNIGETPGVKEWDMFAATIPGTNLKSVYTSESGNAPPDVRAQISELLLENRRTKGKPRRLAHHIPPPGSDRQLSSDFSDADLSSDIEAMTDADQSSDNEAMVAGRKRPAAGPASTLSSKAPRSDSPVNIVEDIGERGGRISTDFRLVEKALGLKERGSGIEEKVHDNQIPSDSKLWIKWVVKPGTSEKVAENYSPETYVLCENPDDHSRLVTGICRDKPGGGSEKWLEIRPSGISGNSGMGLFVSKVLIPGSNGIAFRAGDLIVPYSDRYFIRSSLTQEEEDHIQRTNDYILTAKWFNPPKTKPPQSPKRRNVRGVLFNGKHSIGGKIQQAMSPEDVNCLFGEIGDMGRIPFVQAIRDIKTGDELFVDYGWDDDLQIQRFGKIAIAAKNRGDIDVPGPEVLGNLKPQWNKPDPDDDDTTYDPSMG